MTIVQDKVESLRCHLAAVSAVESQYSQSVEAADKNNETVLQRKIISLGNNVLRIIDSGNKINRQGISDKVATYAEQIESQASDDTESQACLTLLNAIKGVLLTEPDL